MYELTGADGSFLIAMNAGEAPAKLRLETGTVAEGSWLLEYGEGIRIAAQPDTLEVALDGFGFAVLRMKSDIDNAQ